MSRRRPGSRREGREVRRPRRRRRSRRSREALRRAGSRRDPPSSTSPRATKSANILLDVVARTAESVFMPLCVGGGVRSLQDIRDLLNAGRRQGLDHDRGDQESGSRRRGRGQDRQRQPWSWRSTRSRSPSKARRRTGKSSPTAVVTRPGSTRSSGRPRWPSAGPGEILLTSMDRDGTKSGYDLAMLRAVADRISIPVIASWRRREPPRTSRRRSRRRARRAVTARPPSRPRSSTSRRRRSAR